MGEAVVMVIFLGIFPSHVDNTYREANILTVELQKYKQLEPTSRELLPSSSKEFEKTETF